MESAAIAAWGSILRVQASVLPKLEQTVFASTGMSLTWYDVLLELHGAGGRLTMGQLGERVVLSRSRVSRVVDELIVAGCVARETNVDDRRSSFAVLTAEGRARFRAAAKVYLPAIERELGRVDDQILRLIAEGLDAVMHTSSDNASTRDP